MFEAASLSPLDAARFGVVTARAHRVEAGDVPAQLEFCETHDVELLIARCDGADRPASRALALAGMEFLEAQITYRGPLADSGPRPPGIRAALPDDAASVAELAREGFTEYTGHYHADARRLCRLGHARAARRGRLRRRVRRPACRLRSGTEITFQLSVVAAWARGRDCTAASSHTAWRGGVRSTRSASSPTARSPHIAI